MPPLPGTSVGETVTEAMARLPLVFISSPSLQHLEPPIEQTLQAGPQGVHYQLGLTQEQWLGTAVRDKLKNVGWKFF